VPTDCNSGPIRFTPQRRREVLAEFDAGAITSDAGALLLREADRRLRLSDRAAAIIPDPRDPARVEHEQRTMIAQRLYGIACGWEDLVDHQRLRDDPLMQLVTDRPAGVDADRPLAGPSTLCRLENRISRRTCVELSGLLLDSFMESHGGEPPAELVLDFDATDDPVHGHQEQRFFHGYYDHYCFLPLYVFCGTRLLVAYLRPANIDAAKHSRAILKLLVDRLRRAWPDVRIVVRGDGGFCRWRMMRWCDRHRVDYILGVARNKVLERTAAPLMRQAKEQFEQGGQKQRVFGAFDYAAGTWDRRRRVIAKAEHDAKGENPRFVVVSDGIASAVGSGEPRALYEDVYCQRGEMENRIKEQQLGLFADRTSCHGLAANQFRVLLSALAYVLVEHVRRTALAGTELEHAQVGTIRTKLLKVGALVKSSVRRVVLRCSSAHPMAELFRLVAARLTQPAAAAAAPTG
jgi:Transposase DDE domain group 1